MSLVGLQLGKYQVIKQIGSGGMSEIYLANDTALKRQVAIKVVRAEITPYPDSETARNAARLFEREANLISRLDHPHILPLYDFGETSVEGVSLSYLVMPYRPDGSLTNWLRNRGTTMLLQPQEVQYFINQAAEALYYAHNHNIIHRDVKPSNFLIQGNTASYNLPYIQLSDFGIAKLSASTGGTSQSISGTATYMPPEQWRGHPVPASDQYALAVMAYELLTGHVPFEGDLMRLMHQHSFEQPQPPSVLNPRLSPAIDAVLLRAMDKVPENRFPTILDFANAFAQAVQNVPPPPPGSRGSTGSILYPGTRPTNINNVDPNSTILPSTASNSLGRSDPNRRTYPTPAAVPPGTGYVDPNRATYPGPYIPTSVQPVAGQTPILYSSGQNPVVAPSPRPKLPIMLILIAIVLVLILASVAFGGYTIITNNSHANATATTTSNLNSTATTNAQATANIHATANTQATTTANAQATAKVLAANSEPSVYTPPNGTLAYLDPLTGGSADSAWDTGNNCSFLGGKYHVQENKASTFFTCYLAHPTFGNFALQVDLLNTRGDCGGVAFRGNSNSGQEYFFRICQDNTHSYLYRCDGFNKSCQNLANRPAPIEINSGLNQTNTLAVVANGTNISVYVNRIFIDSTTDSTYTNGSIGLVASTINNSTEAVFSNLKVWTF